MEELEKVITMSLGQTSRIQTPPARVANPIAAPQQANRTSAPNLRERKKARARETILATARELIDQKGYANTKMREIARAAEVSYQTLYNYFPTKALILQDLLTRAMPESIGQHLAETPCTNNPLTTTIELIEHYFDAITYCDRDLWREVATELIKAADAQQCLLSVIDRDSRQKFVQLFSESQSSYKLDSGIDPLLVAGTSYQLINGALLDFLSNTTITRAEASQRLSDQVRLLLTPYLIH